MGLFNKPEVVILKESLDSKEYLDKLQNLRATVPDNSIAGEKLDKEIAIVEAGIYGEDSILFELKNSGMNLVILRDLYIETADGRNAQIDYFVITPYANVIIECKNLFGNIEINSKGDFIRTFEYKNKRYKEGIYSPITQNERHLEIYRSCWEENKGLLSKLLAGKHFSDYNKTIVVLANPKTVVNDRYAKKDIKQKVIRGDQLINYLKNIKSDFASSPKSMREAGERILAMHKCDRTDYFKRFEELSQEIQDDTQAKRDISEPLNNDAKKDLVCPRCGGKLVLRTAKKGPNQGNQFYGCSNFPNCKYIINIE